MALVRQLQTISKSVFSSVMSKSLPIRSSRQLVEPVFLSTNTSTTKPLHEKKEVRVTFIRASGERIEAKGKLGDSLLDVVVNNEIDLSGFGACEGTLTCSTCHLILKKEDYDRLPQKPSDEEMDMLDLAYELTDTSRLGCQIILTEDLDGLEIKVPVTINDQRAD